MRFQETHQRKNNWTSCCVVVFISRLMMMRASFFWNYNFYFSFFWVFFTQTSVSMCQSSEIKKIQTEFVVNVSASGQILSLSLSFCWWTEINPAALMVDSSATETEMRSIFLFSVFNNSSRLLCSLDHRNTFYSGDKKTKVAWIVYLVFAPKSVTRQPLAPSWPQICL